jgi:hypothetical protein
MIRFVERCGQLVRAAALVGWSLALGVGLVPHAARAACTGDCNSDGEVTVDELLTMVNIALGSALVSECAAGDESRDGTITVDEIISGVNGLLGGCPPLATPTPTPTAGPLGTRHFVVNSATSSFKAVLSAGFSITLGSFVGQSNGQTEAAFLDLQAHVPDAATGVATVDVVNASEYIFATNPQVGITLCLRPLVPAAAAGSVGCRGGFPFSFETTVNHRIGQVGVQGFTVAECEATCNGGLNCGHVESPNQLCAAGRVGALCRANAECDTASMSNDGICGLGPATCTLPPGNEADCRADADCDSGQTPMDGVCGTPEPHPGVCNGPIVPEVLAGDTGPGEMVIAPNEQFDLQGLPVELLIESAPPCGDEGPGEMLTLALTSGVSRSTILDFNDSGDSLSFDAQGQNFSCTNWQDATGPGRLVLSAPALHSGVNGDDIITAFIFDGSPDATPTQTP